MKTTEANQLKELVQKENFVGWTYSVDYDRALIMTNDLWKVQALGVPHNCFLVAASFNPEEIESVPEADREVILLRVIAATHLPQEQDLIQTKIDHFQRQEGIYQSSGAHDYDDITKNQLQFSGLECRVLGTFYVRDGELNLGSDLESFGTATRLNVYRPRGKSLAIIANYVDPIRRQKSAEEMQQLGLKKPISPFKIGTVRYTSTDRLHRLNDEEKVPVAIQPADFLARRTAIFGMTRTGKSNMVKQMVSVVKDVADKGEIRIGQLIYDINGEYANANQQDKGALADLFPRDTERYRMLDTKGFHDLRNNFYEQLIEGFSLIRSELQGAPGANSGYLSFFLNMSLDEPGASDYGEKIRWEVRVAAYKALLFKAGFEPPPSHKVRFTANKDVRKAVDEAAKTSLPDPSTGLTLGQAVDWFLAARAANNEQPLTSSGKGRWVDDTLGVVLDMLQQKNQNNTFISGFVVLTDIAKYHSAKRTSDVATEIYKFLEQGRIVILDLSVGNALIRESISKQIAAKVFDESMKRFVEGKLPPNIAIYIEEAHNLIGKGMELSDTWPRLAKEGAKYRIALVYATQEVSSVHPNILANTENWFITHLNNSREIRELSQFYDFEDFSRSLLRAQDVGFARVKTLSSPYVIPVQIDKFEPKLKRSLATPSPTTGGPTEQKGLMGGKLLLGNKKAASGGK